MVFPDDLLYNREHMWARIDGNLVVVGVTDYVQEKLGEIFHIELPQVDDTVEQDEPFGTLEAENTVIELIAPISGEVVRVNEDLSEDTGIINSDPYDTGWMVVIEIRDFSELDSLLDVIEYREFIGGEEDLI